MNEVTYYRCGKTHSDITWDTTVSRYPNW